MSDKSEYNGSDDAEKLDEDIWNTSDTTPWVQ
jgi:hypothetical protein